MRIFKYEIEVIYAENQCYPYANLDTTALKTMTLYIYIRFPLNLNRVGNADPLTLIVLNVNVNYIDILHIKQSSKYNAHKKYPRAYTDTNKYTLIVM